MVFGNTSLFSLPFQYLFHRYTCLILAADIAAAVLACLSPLIQRELIDTASAGDNYGTCVLMTLLVLVTGLSFLLGLFSRWQRGLFRIFAQKQLKSTVFKHLLALPEEFIRSRGAAYFFNRIQLDIGEIISFLCGSELGVIVDLIRFIVALAILYRMNWQAAAFATACLLPQIAICLFFKRRQHGLSRDIQECSASQRQLMQEYLENHTALKTHNAITEAEQKVSHGLSQWGTLIRKRLINENLYSTFIQIPIWLCNGGLVLIGLIRVANNGMTLGELWAIVSLVRIVFAPARSMAFFMVPAASAGASWKRLQELDAVRGESTGDDHQHPAPAAESLHFRDVIFAYTQDRPLLRNLSFDLPLGTLLFMTGPNGSGKSTIMSLLLKLYRPQSGRILMGDTPLEDISTAQWRSMVGYLGQNPPFIRGTLRENMLLGSTEPQSDDAILEALRKAGGDIVFKHHAGGLDTPVSQNGDNFSGGERLRLALARELLRNTAFLLLDEPASQLDAEGRQSFYRLLQTLPGPDKTILAIVHDEPQGATCPIFHLTVAEPDSSDTAPPLA